jgi:hypothetical protein
MIKHIIYILLFLLSFSGFSQKNERFDALNDYLDSMIDANEEIVIVKEKITSNETIGIFQGTISIDPDTKKPDRFGGANAPLYIEKYWKIMKNKYGNSFPTIGRNWLKNQFWNATDFRHEKIVFDSYEECKKKLESDGFFYGPQRKIYSFSDPIYYKNKEYITFTVVRSATKSIGFPSDFIIIMKKVKNKWIIYANISNNIMD